MALFSMKRPYLLMFYFIIDIGNYAAGKLSITVSLLPFVDKNMLSQIQNSKVYFAMTLLNYSC